MLKSIERKLHYFQLPPKFAVLAVSLTSHALVKTASCSLNTCTMTYFSGQPLCSKPCLYNLPKEQPKFVIVKVW